MGLDISKIENEALKRLAYECDKKANFGELDEKEFGIFHKKAKKLKGISDQDFNQAMGLYKSDGAKEEEPKVIVETPVEKAAAPVEEKQPEAAPVEEAPEAAPVEEPKKTRAEKKAERQQARTDKKDAKTEAKSVETAVSELVDKKYTPKEILEEVKNTHANYDKDVARVEKWVNAAEAVDCKSKADVDKLKAELIKNEDKKLDKADEKIVDSIVEATKEKVVRQETEEISDKFETVMAKHENDDPMPMPDELKNELIKELGDKYLDKSYHKEAFERFEKGYVELNEAAIMVAIAKSDKTDSKEIVKELKADAKGDKTSLAAIENLEKMGVPEIAARRNTFENRAEELQKYKNADAKDELGDKIYEKLSRSFIDKKAEEGDYSRLSDVVRERMGSDYRVNISTDLKNAEQKRIREDLKDLTGADFSEDEVEKIIKFCKAETYEEKDGIDLKDLAGDTAIGLICGTSLQVAKQTVNTPLGVVSQKVVQFGAGWMALPAAVAVSHLLFHDNKKGYETTAEEIQRAAKGENDERFNSVESQKAFLDKECGDRAEYFKSELDDVVAKNNGVYSYQEWMGRLNQIAGFQSNMNIQEIVGATMERLRKEEPKKVEEQKPAEIYDALVSAEDNRKEEEVTETEEWSYTHIREYGDSWGGIIQAYYPDLGIKPEDIQKDPRLFGKNGLIRQLWHELAKDDDGVFHQDVFNTLCTSHNLPEKIKLPSSLGGAKFVERDVQKIKIEKAQKGYDGSALKEVGHKEYVQVTSTRINGNIVWTAKDPVDPSINAQGTTAKEAYENLKKKLEEQKIDRQYSGYITE